MQKLDGSLTSIQKVEHEELDVPVSVYNFEVEEFHTYYAGSVCVLVHNADYSDEGGSGARGTGKSLSELLDDVKAERIKLQSLSGDDQIKIANQLRLNSPIEIPDNITPIIEYKNGYEQITFDWSDGTYTYEVRWHTATPNAPPGTPPNWRVDRKIPGFAGGRDPVTRAKIQGYSAIEEVLVAPPNAKPYYISKNVWDAAKAAYSKKITTVAQQEILKWAHIITD